MAWSNEIQCAVCGKTIIATNRNQKYCPECAKECQRATNRRAAAARKERRKRGEAPCNVIGGSMTCEMCGVETTRTGYSQKYCRVCARKRELDAMSIINQRKRGPSSTKVGATFRCEKCGQDTIRTIQRQKLCLECRDKLLPQKWFSNQQRIEKDLVNLVALGAAIREIRVNHNLGMEDIAKVTGLTTSAISHLERGRSTPNIETMARLAKAFGLTIDELIPREQDT